MPASAFPCAIYKKDGESKRITPNEIEPNMSYKGHLFCPNEQCSARLQVVRGKKGYFFRGINIKEHIEGCEYYHEYTRYDTEEKMQKTTLNIVFWKH